MFCQKCGQEVEEGAKVCPKCGVELEAKAEAQPKVAPVQPKVAPAQPKVAQPVQQNENPAGNLAICGFVASFFVSLVGIILSAIALKKYKNQENKQNKGLATAGLVLSIVGFVGKTVLVVSIVFWYVIGFILAFAASAPIY